MDEKELGRIYKGESVSIAAIVENSEQGPVILVTPVIIEIDDPMRSMAIVSNFVGAIGATLGFLVARKVTPELISMAKEIIAVSEGQVLDVDKQETPVQDEPLPEAFEDFIKNFGKGDTTPGGP